MCLSFRGHRVTIDLYWLVVWNMNFIFSIQLGIIVPTDFHIFQRGRYTTKQYIITSHNIPRNELGLVPRKIYLFIIFLGYFLTRFFPDIIVTNWLVKSQPVRGTSPFSQLKSQLLMVKSC